MKAKKRNGNKPKGKDAKVVKGITYDDMGDAVKDAAKTVYRGAKRGARAVQRGLDKAPAVMMDAAMGAVEGYGNLGKQLYQTGKLLATGDKEKYGLKANESYKAEQAKVEANKKKAEAEGKAYREKVERERKERAKAKGFKGGGKMPMYAGGGKTKPKKGMKVKKYQGGGMNATGETGRSTLSSATKSGKTAYQQRQETKKKQMDLFEKELSEKGVYLPKQGQLVKELNVDYPIIPSKDESGRTVPFKEGYIRRGYSGADTRMNQKLGVKPIGQNLSK